MIKAVSGSAASCSPSYPMPMDDRIRRAARCSAVRPVHLHVLVNADGYEELTTMLFTDGDPHLDTNPVFG
jgi:hydroxyquinol 1,2-dioxygenase